MPLTLHERMIFMAKSKSTNGKNVKKNQQPVQEKTVVKKKSGCLPLFILLLAVIALIIWLMSHFNIGFFGKDGDKGKSSSGADYSDMTVNDRKPPETTENQDNGKKIVDITVCGNQYYYNDGKTEIDDFIDEIKAMDGQIFVYITDDDAYADDMKKLKDALTKADIPYIEPTDNNNN